MLWSKNIKKNLFLLNGRFRNAFHCKPLQGKFFIRHFNLSMFNKSNSKLPAAIRATAPRMVSFPKLECENNMDINVTTKRLDLNYQSFPN